MMATGIFRVLYSSRSTIALGIMKAVSAALARICEGRTAISFGKPLNFVGQFDGVPLGRARRQVTDVIMNEIQQLSGQEFAGVYNDRPPTID